MGSNNMHRLEAKESEALNDRIRELAISGLRNKQIAEKLGVKISVVTGRVHNMSKRGELPSATERKKLTASKLNLARILREENRVPTGSFREIFESLTSEELNWLYSVTPKGMKISGVLVLLIRDAYAEENG